MSNFQLNHRPALDGLRGVSILLVLIGHLDLPRITTRGGIVGVHFFFALSGFLITSLLLEEWKERKSIQFGRFYARRALRLLPALVVLLILLVAIASVTDGLQGAQATAKSAGIVAVYASNWAILAGKFPNREYLAHTWSLSIEEQFYILWPVTLLVLLRIFGKPLRVAWVVAMLVGLVWWRRYSLVQDDFTRIYFGSDTNADVLLSGAFLALLLAGGLDVQSTVAKNTIYFLGVVMVLACPILLCNYRNCALYCLQLGMPLLEAGLGVLILSLLFTPLRTLFEARWLIWLGKLSYSLYLWHYPIYFWVKAGRGGGPGMQLIGTAATLLAGSVSYYLVERPALRWKKNFEPRMIQSVTTAGA